MVLQQIIGIMHSIVAEFMDISTSGVEVAFTRIPDDSANLTAVQISWQSIKSNF